MQNIPSYSLAVTFKNKVVFGKYIMFFLPKNRIWLMKSVNKEANSHANAVCKYTVGPNKFNEIPRICEY